MSVCARADEKQDGEQKRLEVEEHLEGDRISSLDLLRLSSARSP